eukprot:363682-Chlamydomonas_euryale.AAC.4
MTLSAWAMHWVIASEIGVAAWRQRHPRIVFACSHCLSPPAFPPTSHHVALLTAVLRICSCWGATGGQTLPPACTANSPAQVLTIWAC